MATTTTSQPVPTARSSVGVLDAWRENPPYQAFWLLRFGFTAAPILFGLDKFAHVLVNWDKYLAPWIDRIVPGTAHQAMYAVGVIEIVAGLVVAWLAGIIVNLLTYPGFYDIALRDFGLLLGALTLARLATAFAPTPVARR